MIAKHSSADILRRFRFPRSNYRQSCSANASAATTLVGDAAGPLPFDVRDRTRAAAARDEILAAAEELIRPSAVVQT